MNFQVSLSFRRIVDRLSRYFMAGEGYNYSSPLHLLSIFSRLERLNADAGASSRARPGSLLLLQILQTEETCIIRLVSPTEADPDRQQISVLSPLGASLLGMSPGDTCRVHILGSTYHFKLIGILD